MTGSEAVVTVETNRPTLRAAPANAAWNDRTWREKTKFLLPALGIAQPLQEKKKKWLTGASVKKKEEVTSWIHFMSSQ